MRLSERLSRVRKPRPTPRPKRPPTSALPRQTGPAATWPVNRHRSPTSRRPVPAPRLHPPAGSAAVPEQPVVPPNGSADSRNAEPAHPPHQAPSVPVPQGYRQVGWIRPHEAAAAAEAYRLARDVTGVDPKGRGCRTRAVPRSRPPRRMQVPRPGSTPPDQRQPHPHRCLATRTRSPGHPDRSRPPQRREDRLHSDGTRGPGPVLRRRKPRDPDLPQHHAIAPPQADMNGSTAIQFEQHPVEQLCSVGSVKTGQSEERAHSSGGGWSSAPAGFPPFGLCSLSFAPESAPPPVRQPAPATGNCVTPQSSRRAVPEFSYTKGT